MCNNGACGRWRGGRQYLIPPGRKRSTFQGNFPLSLFQSQQDDSPIYDSATCSFVTSAHRSMQVERDQRRCWKHAFPGVGLTEPTSARLSRMSVARRAGSDRPSNALKTWEEVDVIGRTGVARSASRAPLRRGIGIALQERTAAMNQLALDLATLSIVVTVRRWLVSSTVLTLGVLQRSTAISASNLSVTVRA